MTDPVAGSGSDPTCTALVSKSSSSKLTPSPRCRLAVARQHRQ
jgi:hypothetical protein